jgi:UPF0755 protein
MKQYVAVLLGIAVLLSGCSGAPSGNGTTTRTTNTTASSTVASSVESELTTTTTTVLQTTLSTTVKTTLPVTTTTTATTTMKTTTTTATMTTATTASTGRQEVTVTIPEGFTFMEIARLLEKSGVCTAKAFYEVCQGYTPQSFTIPLSEDRCFRMEGYLFPDTYRFYVNDNPQTVLIRMLNNFRAKVGTLSDDVLILASIIEQEARSDEHMKLVSSVFHNRLNHRGEYPYLNADPTRDYVNEHITGNELLADTAKYAALYNTCGKRKGLPAGPICSPGLRAIHAAQNPTPSPYYYFFYGKDFTNHYSETLEEHEQTMADIGVG